MATTRTGRPISIVWHRKVLPLQTPIVNSPFPTPVAVPFRPARDQTEHVFFIAAGFYKPHTPWITPRKYFDRYIKEQISLPAISAETPTDYPELALASTKPWPYFGIKPDQAMECKLAYYAAISFVDAQIGRLLNALDSLGLRDNTIIVFWSDHGYHSGEHGLLFKQSCFEELAKSPFIISVPKIKTAGQIGYGFRSGQTN